MIKRIVFLEGLPGVGKTTIIRKIQELNLENVHVVEEIINESNSSETIGQDFFMLNDEMKINKYTDGVIVIDRGAISTLSYNQTKRIINNFNYNSREVEVWFEKIEKLYQDLNVKIIFLTNRQTSFYLPYRDENDPYGSIENQKLLESISLYNCQKFSNKLIIKEYYKQNMEEIIYEIFN